MYLKQKLYLTLTFVLVDYRNWSAPKEKRRQIGYNFIKWRQQYWNSSFIADKNVSILYVTFYNRGLEILLLIGLFVTFFSNFSSKTTLCRVS